MKHNSNIRQRIGFLSIQEAEGIKNIKGKSSLKVFFKKGYECVSCGIQGTYFGIDILKCKMICIRLYAINTKGEEVLMTQDHIIPKSKGGNHGISNLQPMCECCNTEKADKCEIVESNVEEI